MSINTAPLADDTGMKGFMVAAPRSSDPISGALRAAFGLQPDSISDDFSALLRRIDQADREASSH
ncbi:hypothetical protein GCM10009087_16010 [Sphingomonas oligophenolica]|uniref:Anti-sigma factor NepR domain-containing protein n=1 Tax=Sphingomonas oligophenolica TaxID=301154 RepID=A0ABU9Y7W1_9SPHN